MIPRNKLKFNETDLKFFDKQLEDKSKKIKDIHKSLFYFLINNKHSYFNGQKLAKRFNIKDVDIRAIITDIRRYRAHNKSKYFITANKNGYTLSEANCCDNCNNAIVDYFNKTQTRWKETFYELNNLMKLLNMIK